MHDREKVIKGLRICVPETQDDSKLECSDCPYEDVCNPNDIVGITLPLIWDIRALLKEQERKDKMFHALEDEWKKLKELLKEQEAKNSQLNRFVNGFSRDAVPVVRCRDCKHGRQYATNAIDCEYRELATEPDWFCADGERKEVMMDDSTIFQRNCAGTQCGGQDPEGT